jgi:hypothetical protein
MITFMLMVHHFLLHMYLELQPLWLHVNRLLMLMSLVMH